MIEAVVAALSGRRYRYSTEKELHLALSAALDEAGIEHQREVPITGGRIDFLIGDLGVEVKIKGSASALRRQVAGYAESDRIAELLVVTTRPIHRPVSGAYNGKDVHVLTIGGLSL